MNKFHLSCKQYCPIWGAKCDSMWSQWLLQSTRAAERGVLLNFFLARKNQYFFVTTVTYKPERWNLLIPVWRFAVSTKQACDKLLHNVAMVVEHQHWTELAFFFYFTNTNNFGVRYRMEPTVTSLQRETGKPSNSKNIAYMSKCRSELYREKA